MICPACGAEVPESKQCPECGAALQLDGMPADHSDTPEDAAFKQGDADGYWQISFDSQPADSAASPEEGRCESFDADIDELIFGSQASGSEGESEEPESLSAASALSIAGLAAEALIIICVLGVVFTANAALALSAAVPALGFLTALAVIGLLCSIAGLVLNVRSNRSEQEEGQGGTSTLLSAAGLIVGICALILLILLNSTARQALDAANENGWDVDQVQIAQGSDGSIVVTERSESATGTTPQSVLPSSSSAASPSTSSSASSASSSAVSLSSGASRSSSGAVAPSESVYYDTFGNPTLYALIELNGSDLQDMLKADDFAWYDEITAWLKKNGAVFQVVNRNGNVPRGDIEKLSVGAAGAPVAYVLSAKGYASPQQALAGLTEGVSVDAHHESDGAVFAVIHGTNGEKHLVLVTTTGDSEQAVLVYGETAIKEGLFRDTIGIEVGSSVTDAWSIVAG